MERFGGERRRTGAFGGGYTWFVRLAKIALPLAALAVVGIVIARMNESPLQQVENVPQEEKTVPGQIELVKAQYEGTDDKGRPYALIAERARRAGDADETVLLDQLKADITLEDGSWIAVHAANGAYATKTEKLNLTGGVDIFHDSGYEMHLQDIAVDMKSRRAESKNPVTAQGPLGEITGSTLDVSEGGTLITFGGPATLTLHHLGDKG